MSENFAAGVLDRWGFGWNALQELREDIIYVSNCGFGHTGPYAEYKTWGPIVQAMSGLTFTSGLPDSEPAGWGYSYMDHTGGMYMAMAILFALLHKQRTGEGQFIDMSLFDVTVASLANQAANFLFTDTPPSRLGNAHPNIVPIRFSRWLMAI